MNQHQPASYEPQEWQNRQYFVRIITNICRELDITLTWFSDSWIARLQKGPLTHYVVGYVFPLNTTATGMLMRDKAATATLLADAGVPVIAHHLLMLPRLRGTGNAVAQAQQLAMLPFVVKPATGEGGFDVYKCTTQNEVQNAVADLALRHRLLAVSPYIPISREFRVVLLGTQPLLTFEKQRKPGEWRHNLHNGATPVQVTNTALAQKLHALAKHALQALQGRLAAVDIAETPDGLKIIEINNGIALNYVARSARHTTAAADIYRRIIATIFKL